MQTLNRPIPHPGLPESGGPVEWLQPHTDAIKELGRRALKIYSLFRSALSLNTSKHKEIDIEYREIAEHSGIHNFRRVPALNSHPLFIEAMADLVPSEVL